MPRTAQFWRIVSRARIPIDEIVHQNKKTPKKQAAVNGGYPLGA